MDLQKLMDRLGWHATALFLISRGIEYKASRCRLTLGFYWALTLVDFKEKPCISRGESLALQHRHPTPAA